MPRQRPAAAPSGSRSSASSAACTRMARVLVGPQQQHRDVDAAGRRRAARAARPRGQRRASFAHERARFALPPTSASAWRTRSRAAGLERALSRTPRVGPQRDARAVRQRAVEAGHRADARDAPPARPTCGPRRRGGAAASACRMSRAGACAAARRARRTSSRAELVAADERPRAADVRAEAGDDLGQPVRRVRVARAVLGVAVQRQVGQHDAVAVLEALDERRQLAVAEQRGVPEDQRRAGARLAVGDARAVGVVVEAELHARVRPGAADLA